MAGPAATRRAADGAGRVLRHRLAPPRLCRAETEQSACHDRRRPGWRVRAEARADGGAGHSAAAGRTRKRLVAPSRRGDGGADDPVRVPVSKFTVIAESIRESSESPIDAPGAGVALGQPGPVWPRARDPIRSHNRASNAGHPK